VHAELLDGKRPNMPVIDVAAAFPSTPREPQDRNQQELGL
jgi:hypothetical protein